MKTATLEIGSRCFCDAFLRRFSAPPLRSQVAGLIQVCQTAKNRDGRRGAAFSHVLSRMRQTRRVYPENDSVDKSESRPWRVQATTFPTPFCVDFRRTELNSAASRQPARYDKKNPAMKAGLEERMSWHALDC
ncbi:hypothetical protein [Bordetella genomosp. 5]|uniref:hypothetical protein n=1 Tax=Bordetella genomosp. 5 TaxID=1395608 RepID=UPI0011401851|nr:hypothetical protein [Bordetella genomosp. 5]